MSHHHRIRLAAALSALALASGALTGCSLIPDPVRDVVDQAQDNGIENPLGSIPDDWPAEVPIVEGEVLVGIKPTEGSWGATIKVADEAAAQEAVTLLTDAGFTELIPGTTSFENANYTVVVQWGDIDEGGVGVAYVVAKKES